MRRTFLVNCSPVLGTGGKHGGVLISLDDVTQLEASKAELETSKEEAEAANRAKSDFLANMSHEIRTPMNAILGFTEVLKRGYGKSDGERRRYLDTIHSSGSHLLELINDLLDLSKVESGKLDLERMRFAAHVVAHEVVTTLAVNAQEKGISLTLEVDGTLPETVEGDPTRLRQIITNVVSNAIKFTEVGGVRVVLGVEGPPSARTLRIDVVDSGVGIPEDKVESVFDPFVQADSSVTRKFGGTGLGLAISRRFARMMGGDIVASSAPGEGSTFTVTLDPGSLDDVALLEPEAALRAAAQSASDDDGAQWRFPAARVLVVDDGAENRELVELVLGEAGLDVTGAENGAVAVDRVLSEGFDLVLMDIQMPVMDGFTATARLREAGVETPIIALSANAMKGFDEECLARGFTGFLTKPVDIDRLVQTLAGLLGGQREAPVEDAAASPRTEGDSAPPPALTADAAPIRSRLAGGGARLRQTIASFVERLDGQLEAMEAASAAGDFARVAELAHWLKGAGGTVGFDDLTEPAAELEQMAKAGEARGVSTTIESLRALQARVEHAGPGPAAAAVGKPPRLAVSTDAAIPAPAPAPAPAGRDRAPRRPTTSDSPIVSRLAGRSPRLTATLERFVEALPGKLHAMDACQRSGDLVELAQLAHWLKGAGGTVGFDELTEPARLLEASAQAGERGELETTIGELRVLAARIARGVTRQPAAADGAERRRSA
jgi:CheY-like chemotaxis protein/nitrogen-specific signal transduction histidine kinase/HPt (histidine-containing phosphotransfer) domain-containing protein